MFTFLEPPATIDRVIVSTTSEENLEAELVSGESLVHLELLDVYIVDGVNPANVEDRVEDFELTEGVESELHIYSLWEEPYVPDYIDSNGNLTLRIEIPGPAFTQYLPTFDQVCVRFLRANEEE